MKSINYTELVNVVSSDLSLTKRQVDLVLSKALYEIKARLKAREKISIRDFGSFEPAVVRPKQSRSIKTGKLVMREGGHRVKFKSGKALKDLFKDRVEG